MSWNSYYQWYYQHHGRTQIVVVGNTRANVALLAFWVLCRWSWLHNSGSELSRALRTAGWYPNRSQTDSNYTDSFMVLTSGGQVRPGILGEEDLERLGIRAGQRYFAALTREYIRSITMLGENMRRHLFARYSGIVPLQAAERESLVNTVNAWDIININSCPWHGIPDIGLPYGSPIRYRRIVGSHRERIQTIVRLMRYTQEHPGEEAPDDLSRDAGFYVNYVGEGQTPYMRPWF